MSDTFTVEAVTRDPRPSEYKGTAKLTHYLRLATEPLPVQWWTDASTPAPKAGDKLEGSLNDKEFNGEKYKEFRKAGGGGKSFKQDPAKARSIARQHAQKVALDYAKVKAEKEDLPSPFKISDLKPIIDWLYEDVMKATGS